MENRQGILLIAGVVLAVFIACSSSYLTMDQTFNALKPLKEIMTSKEAPVNLIIRINHVADEKSSYKNTVEIRVNGKRILPADPVTNIQRDFVYKLKLRPGYYKVEGKYFNAGGWDVETFNIKAHDLARVMPGQRTILTVDLKKNPDGSLIAKDAYLTEQYEQLSQTDTGLEPDIKKRDRKAKEQLTSGSFKVADSAPARARKAVLSSQNSIVLRIETDPVECLVRVDDSDLGKSPINISVNRFEDHVIRISKTGYRNITRILDQNLFVNQSELHLAQKLEPLVLD